MLRSVALVIDILQERIASVIKVERISKLGTALPFLVTVNIVPSSSILSTMMIEAIRSSETSVLATGTRRNIPEDGNLHSHRSEKLNLI
jgi:hypothetical protein